MTCYADLHGGMPEFKDEVAEGDRLIGQNSTPVWVVEAVRGDRLWVRREDTGADAIVPKGRLRKAA